MGWVLDTVDVVTNGNGFAGSGADFVYSSPDMFSWAAEMGASFPMPNPVPGASMPTTMPNGTDGSSGGVATDVWGHTGTETPGFNGFGSGSSPHASSSFQSSAQQLAAATSRSIAAAQVAAPRQVNSGVWGVPGYKWVGTFPATSQASTSAPPWAGSLHPSLPGWKNPYYPGDKSVDPSSDPYSDEPGFSFGDNFTHDAPNSDGFQAGFRLYFGGNGNNLSIGGAGNTSQYFNFFNPLGTGLFGGFGTGFSYGNKSNPLTGLGHTEDMSPTPPEYYGY